MENLTPGRKLILDLLAKSVAKIQAAEVENEVKVEDVKTDGRKGALKRESMEVPEQFRKKMKAGKKSERLIHGTKEDDLHLILKASDIKAGRTDYRDKKKNIVEEVKLGSKDKMLDNLKVIKSKKRKRKVKTEIKTEEIDLESYVKTEFEANIVINESKEDIIKGDGESKIKQEPVEEQNLRKEYFNLVSDLTLKETTPIPVAESQIKDDYYEQITKTKDVVKKERSLKKEYLRLEPGLTTLERKQSTSKDKLNVLKQVAGKNRVKSIRTSTRTTRRRFSPEEEQILLNAIKTSGGKIDYRQLAEDFQRTHDSILNEVGRLKKGKERRKKRLSFTLSEDIIILDAVLKNIGEESLEDVYLTPSGWREVGNRIGRNERSVIGRWSVRLRPWILQHLAGTLNLEIKRPLANYLAENFSDLNSIDWARVTEKPEFAGHTYTSLRDKFAQVFRLAKDFLQKKGEDITLEMIAEFANTKYEVGERKVPDKDVKRQKEIIDYFECYVNSNSIKDSF